jgi:hypothetical protein
MTNVTIPKARLRELEICAELGANLVTAMADAKGDLIALMKGAMVALAQYEARMAVEKARVE